MIASCRRRLAHRAVASVLTIAAAGELLLYPAHSAAAVEPETASAAALAEPIETVERGSSSRTARLAAADALPMSKMPPEHRAQAQEVIRTAALFRRLPTLRFEVEPAVYRFFTDRPEAAVSVWQALGISKFRLRALGADRFAGDAGDGTKGTISVLYRSEHQHLVLCEGDYTTPLLPKPIMARSLIHLETRFERAVDGRVVALHRADVFAAFPSQSVETVAKVVSPVSHVVMDRNFREVSLFVHMMSSAMRRQPAWVEQLAFQLEGVEDDCREGFLQLSARVYAAERQRGGSGESGWGLSRKAGGATSSVPLAPRTADRP